MSLDYGIILKVSQFRKQIVKPWILPKNERMNLFLLLCDVFSFVFWMKLKTPKKPFEINWPLEERARKKWDQLRISNTSWKRTWVHENWKYKMLLKFESNSILISKGQNIWLQIPYARHYKPRLVYFLPHFQRPFLCFQGGFFRKFCP